MLSSIVFAGVKIFTYSNTVWKIELNLYPGIGIHFRQVDAEMTYKTRHESEYVEEFDYDCDYSPTHRHPTL